MSTRRLNFEVTTTGVGGFTSSMGRIDRGLMQVSNGLRRGGTDSTFMANQLKALGTTARYYLAGRLVFGVQTAIQNLGEFRSQLGEIDALATKVTAGGKVTDLGGQLNKVGQDALLLSNQFGQSVGDVEAYMQRFQTAIGSGLKNLDANEYEKQITQFTKAHLALVTVLGARAGDPNELAGGLAALVRGMPGGDARAGPNAQILSNYFARLVTQEPQLGGADIASAAGRLASARTLGHMSTRDLLATFGLAAQTGGSPSVITRGITQLIGTSLLHPTRPQSLAAYQQAGLPTTSNELAQLGGMNVLKQLIQYAAPGGHLNRDRAYALFSRQESVRQFVNIIANGGVQGLQRFTDSLDQAAKTNFADVAAQRRLQYSGLIRARTAVSNLGVALAAGADPVLENLYARPITYLSNAAIRHPKVTSAAVDTGLALGAANALRRYGALSGIGRRVGGRFGKVGNFIGGASAVEQGLVSSAISKEELPAAIGGGAADGSRANPYWVIISPLSWSVGSPGGFSSSTGGGGGGGKGGFFSKIGNAVKRYAGYGASGLSGLGLAGSAVVAGVGAIPAVYNELYKHFLEPDGRPVPPGHPRLARYARMEDKNIGSGLTVGSNPLPPRINRILDKFGQGKISADIAEKLLGQPQGSRASGPGMFTALSQAIDKSFRKTSLYVEGVAKVEVDITSLDAQGRRHTVRRGVDVKLIPARSFPTKQGRPGSRRGGH